MRREEYMEPGWDQTEWAIQLSLLIFEGYIPRPSVDV